MTIRVSDIVGDSEGTWNTATGLFVELPERLVVITAWHVIEKFVEIREAGGTPLVVIGNAPFICPEYVFLDERNDIVVLDVPLEHALKLNAIPYTPKSRWPPPRVATGDTIIVCGFPAMLRKHAEEILHGDFSFLGGVESASEHQFIVQIDPSDVENIGRVSVDLASADLGGLSGSPVFVLYKDHMQLAGVFSQAAESAPVWIVRSLAHLPTDLGRCPPTRV